MSITLNDLKQLAAKPNGGKQSFAITEHATRRYMERSGVKDTRRAVKQLDAISRQAVSVGDGLCYANGWLMAIHDGLLITIFRPRTPRQKQLVKNQKDS